MSDLNEKYDFPVYGTQGGGLAREAAPGIFIFVEEPVGSGLGVGDRMPPDWSIVPANELARKQMLDDQFGTEEENFRDILRILTKYQ